LNAKDEGAELMMDSDDEEDEDEDLESRILKERSKLQSQAGQEGKWNIGSGEQKVKKRVGAYVLLWMNSSDHRLSVIHYTDTPCSEHLYSCHDPVFLIAGLVLFVSCASPLDPVKLAVTYLDEVKQSGIARTR